MIMTTNTFNLLVVFVVVFLVLAVWILHRRFVSRREDWLPRELRNTELVYAEKLFRSGGDVPIIAKCDRGYRKRDGVMVMVELKTRKLNRVYPSDIIELSAQRYAIQMQTGEEVADYGYVLIQRAPTEGKHRHRVKLLSHDVVEVLAIRRHAILNGEAVGKYAKSKGLCRHCSFASECKSVANPLD
jgi:hypothetical protein